MRLSIVPVLALGLLSGLPLPSADLGTDLALMLVPQANTLVNPSLQPADLAERYLAVVILEVTAVDSGSNSIDLAVRSVVKGNFAAATVRLSASADEVVRAMQVLADPGVEVVAFIGQKGRNRENSILFYMGGEGRWQNGAVTTVGHATAAATWDWTKDLGNEMYGTFNGHPGRLGELVRDSAAGRAYFPAIAFDRFRNDQVLGKLPGAARGVALYDIDGDGRLDALAVGPAGSGLWVQREALAFTEVSEATGLRAVTGSSVDCTDVDADGRVDLLVDGRLLLQDQQGRFAASALLPAITGTVLMSRFVDLDGDGWADVVVAIEGAGLRTFRHPGTAGTAFIDTTSTNGLDRAALAAAYVIPGDWRSATAPALFVASGAGSLLEDGADGGYAATTRMPVFDFSTLDGGRTGAGACAPLWHADRNDLVFSTNSAVNIVSFLNGKAKDVGRYGNETVVVTTDCLGLLAEDLNADGHVDLYAISRTPGSTNNLYDNRGYGSFMVAMRYDATGIPGKAHTAGTLGVAAGDANGDGANDLLLSSVDGQVTLVVNDVLTTRGTVEHPTQQEAALAQVALLHVDVRGPRGVTGANVTVSDATGRVVALRTIASSPVTGCRGPDSVAIAVRQPGAHTITVRWSDGTVRAYSVTLVARQRVVVAAERR